MWVMLYVVRVVAVVGWSFGFNSGCSGCVVVCSRM